MNEVPGIMGAAIYHGPAFPERREEEGNVPGVKIHLVSISVDDMFRMLHELPAGR